jgi:hypothetical protein
LDWRDTLSVDEICLTLPADDAFHGVAHLVLGGLAVRLDLTFEHLEDIELALDSLLERTGDEGEVTVRVLVTDGELRTIVGPLTYVGGDLDESGSDGLNLRRILSAVCDSVAVEERDGAQWVELTKRVETKIGGAG